MSTEAVAHWGLLRSELTRRCSRGAVEAQTIGHEVLCCKPSEPKAKRTKSAPRFS
jgi:hypothetical protein